MDVEICSKTSAENRLQKVEKKPVSLQWCQKRPAMMWGLVRYMVCILKIGPCVVWLYSQHDQDSIRGPCCLWHAAWYAMVLPYGLLGKNIAALTNSSSIHTAIFCLRWYPKLAYLKRNKETSFFQIISFEYFVRFPARKWCTLQETITYPTMGISENHRLTSACWDGIGDRSQEGI